MPRTIRYDDNGIKFFDREGSKLADELEEAIESHLDEPTLTRESGALGRATRVDNERALYQAFCASTLPRGMRLDGLKLVIDCANGAAYKVAPRVLADLGAEIVPIGCSPNGRNINDGCGSTEPALLKLTVSGVRADAGLALDGDGDRLVMADHLGRAVDGDQLLYVLTKARLASGDLKGPVVGTVMSNLGLELALKELGVPFMRAAVGDRNVLQLLRAHGGMLGGEASGHLLCLDKTTTGDGLIVALQVVAVMKATGKSLAELAAGMQRFPQQLINVRVAKRFDAAREPSVASRDHACRTCPWRARPRRTARLRNRAVDPRDGRRRGRAVGRAPRRGTRCGSPRRGARRMSSRDRKPLVAGNWKMHGSRAEAARLVGELISRGVGVGEAGSHRLSAFRASRRSRRASSRAAASGSAARTSARKSPARTPARFRRRMLADIGCRYVIVGPFGAPRDLRRERRAGRAQVRRGAAGMR